MVFHVVTSQIIFSLFWLTEFYFVLEYPLIGHLKTDFFFFWQKFSFLNDLLDGIPKQIFFTKVNKKKLQGKKPKITYIIRGKTRLTLKSNIVVL